MATVVRRKLDMTADFCKFRGQGIAFTATAGATTDYDYKFTEGRLLEVPIILVKNQAWGDYLRFQVVDVDNVIGYGAGAVLDEFATTWYMDDQACTQQRPDVWYSAEVVAGLYIRVKYTSVGIANVDVKINLCNHKVTA
jgi:hypothetical protein